MTNYNYSCESLQNLEIWSYSVLGYWLTDLSHGYQNASTWYVYRVCWCNWIDQKCIVIRGSGTSSGTGLTAPQPSVIYEDNQTCIFITSVSEPNHHFKVMVISDQFNKGVTHYIGVPAPPLGTVLGLLFGWGQNTDLPLLIRFFDWLPWEPLDQSVFLLRDRDQSHILGFYYADNIGTSYKIMISMPTVFSRGNISMIK